MESSDLDELIHKMEVEYESNLKKCDFIEEYLEELKKFKNKNNNFKNIPKQKSEIKNKEELIPWKME